MKKTSLSHAFGAFLSFIAAVGLSTLIRDFLPDIYEILISLSVILKNFIPFATELELVYAILTFLLMLLWGIGFYLKQSN